MECETLDEYNTETLIEAYNSYLCNISNGDDAILLADDFAETMKTYDDPLWILDRAFYGNYEPQAYAYGFDGNGNIKSYSIEKDVRDEILGDDEFVKVAKNYIRRINEIHFKSKD